MRTSTRLRRIVSGLALCCAATALAACSPAADAGPGQQAGASVAIEHVFGSTEIPEDPQRIVTLGWYSQDVVAALGVVPVGVQDFSWGSVDRYLPWFQRRVEELGGELPEILRQNDAGEYDEEQILALEPDLILASHSGIDETQYQRLSEIAPTVAYPELPWASERERLTLDIGRALGRQEQARQLLDEADAAIAAAAARHPEFRDVVFTYGWYLPEGETSVDFYLQRDPRVQLVEQLGFVSSPQIAEAAAGSDEFTVSVSLERLGTVESEFHIGWGDGPADVTRTVEHPLISRWGPIAAGSHYFFVDDTELAWATTAPSVLSIPETVDEIAERLASGLKTA